MRCFVGEPTMFRKFSSYIFLAAVAGVCLLPTVGHAKKVRETVVAVFPFKVLNPATELKHLGEGASEAVINHIVREGAVKVVEESQLGKAIDVLARNQTGLFTEDSALQVGKMVDARFVVIGSVDVLLLLF